jgi:hypothetical protein
MVQLGTLTVESSASIDGILDVNNNFIINVSTPIASGDAANKGYVDSQIGDNRFLIALNENITGLSNEFGPCATPATIVVDNNGRTVNT